VNKSFITNFLALIAIIVGYAVANNIIFTVGLFALSGAITNWLAIHMLFERVPFLYGSGVIPARFEDFKIAIRALMMEQFFTEENIDRFLAGGDNPAMTIDLAPVINKVDLSPAFDNLVSVVEQSSFGGMLAMVGGTEAVIEISQSDEFNAILREELEQPNIMAGMREKVSDIIEKRLNELTPQLVKEIVQRMIREHLGWLVVWGGVFGGIIGLIAALTTQL
jgi:uncharacterized membrane protein YheB (UPF0754 family)